MMTFDTQEIAKAINGVRDIRRAAICAACAERLIPLHEIYWLKGNASPSLFRNALDSVWEYLAGEVQSPSALEELFESTKDSVPDEDEVAEDPYAQDAAISVAYALDVCRSHDVASVVTCLEQAYNGVDSYVLNQLVHDGVIGVEIEAQILSHPIVQQELERQQSDIE